MKEARIPFAGFYGTMWDDELDCEEEQLAESLAEDYDLSVSDVADKLFYHMDYQEVYKRIAAAYVLRFQDFINEGLGLDIKLVYNDMTSPREYNFETDKIYVGISYPDAVRLARRVGRDALREAAKAMFTSRSGFISFYPNDPARWGRLAGWDQNHLYALFTAAVEKIGDEDAGWDILDDVRKRGVFSAALDAGLDYSALTAELSAMPGAKKPSYLCTED